MLQIFIKGNGRGLFYPELTPMKGKRMREFECLKRFYPSQEKISFKIRIYEHCCKVKIENSNIVLILDK